MRYGIGWAGEATSAKNILSSLRGIVARSETPNPIVALLSAASFKIIHSAEYEEFRRKNDLDPDWEDAKS